MKVKKEAHEMILGKGPRGLKRKQKLRKKYLGDEKCE